VGYPPLRGFFPPYAAAPNKSHVTKLNLAVANHSTKMHTSTDIFSTTDKFVVDPFSIRNAMIFRRLKSLLSGFLAGVAGKYWLFGDSSANMPRDGYSLTKDIMPKSGSSSFTKTKVISYLDMSCVKVVSQTVNPSNSVSV
jgi:hypothetical protein